jgi:hypothetical protein
LKRVADKIFEHDQMGAALHDSGPLPGVDEGAIQAELMATAYERYEGQRPRLAGIGLCVVVSAMLNPGLYAGKAGIPGVAPRRLSWAHR